MYSHFQYKYVSKLNYYNHIDLCRKRVCEVKKNMEPNRTYQLLNEFLVGQFKCAFGLHKIVNMYMFLLNV